MPRAIVNGFKLSNCDAPWIPSFNRKYECCQSMIYRKMHDVISFDLTSIRRSLRASDYLQRRATARTGPRVHA